MKSVFYLLAGLLLVPARMAWAGEQPWALLTGSEAGILIHQCSRESPEAIESVWTPAAGDIARMESRLTDIAALESTACCGAGSKVADVTAYYRQYAGLVIEGRRLIYINAFARTAAPRDWRKQAVLMCDGGLAFWGVLYDPVSGTFSDLAFNGDGAESEPLP